MNTQTFDHPLQFPKCLAFVSRRVTQNARPALMVKEDDQTSSTPEQPCTLVCSILFPSSDEIPPSPTSTSTPNAKQKSTSTVPAISRRSELPPRHFVGLVVQITRSRVSRSHPIWGNTRSSKKEAEGSRGVHLQCPVAAAACASPAQRGLGARDSPSPAPQPP